MYNDNIGYLMYKFFEIFNYVCILNMLWNVNYLLKEMFNYFDIKRIEFKIKKINF